MDNNGKTKMGRPICLPSGDNPVAVFRKARGLSQLQAAQILGISRAAISRYERGDLDIPKPVLLMIELLLKTGAK